MTAPPFQPVARTTVVDHVTEQLRSRILSGGFLPGTRLPPERELAGQLGVNRLTLRAALSRLETQGLITTRHGTGSVVRDYREHAGVEMVPDLLRVARANDATTYLALVRDMLELRRTIAVEAVVLAARRHTQDDLIALRAAAQAQASRVHNVLAFARGDLGFARLVVRTARNLALELLLNTMARLPEEDPALVRLMYPRPRLQYQHYETVIGLIESGDGALARETMRAALEAIDRITLARIGRETVRHGKKHKGEAR